MGPFDNDTAADWCGDLNDAEPAERLDMIRQALADAADTDGYLDSSEACEALAAAAIVAAQRPGGPEIDDVYGPDFLSGGAPIELPADLAPLAVRAIDRILGDHSEWRDLWEDSGALPKAHAALTPIRAALLPHPAP
ncbi:DUF4259 domain-containing protein [Spongiactinospora rosea]|uniref:DUF4259 domain-containing protein n=1 Tax=Spongiactinospora rosea TaxID=2248750 RepID=UPI0018F7162B|nr:DUF4259 domain-containing protein [Spongiactinospora rosea]